MAAIKPSIKDILCLEMLPIVLEKSYEMEAFVMGHHVYKETWTSIVDKKLDTAMQPNKLRTNMLLQFFKKERRRSLVSSSPWKVWKVCKDYFLLSKSS